MEPTLERQFQLEASGERRFCCEVKSDGNVSWKHKLRGSSTKKLDLGAPRDFRRSCHHERAARWLRRVKYPETLQTISWIFRAFRLVTLSKGRGFVAFGVGFLHKSSASALCTPSFSWLASYFPSARFTSFTIGPAPGNKVFGLDRLSLFLPISLTCCTS